MKQRVIIFWFRRDLRLQDNAGLYHALRAGLPVVPVFIFDRHILDALEDPYDRRVGFIHDRIQELQLELLRMNSSLDVRYGFPETIFMELAQDYEIEAVFTNHDYEPYARERDVAIGDQLKSLGIGFRTFKDQVIFEKEEIVKQDGSPYGVYTPYARKWKATLQATDLHSFNTQKWFQQFFRQPQRPVPTLREMGFFMVAGAPAAAVDHALIRQYQSTRDFPFLPGTSRLGVHLRFGTISIRQLASIARDHSETFLGELIWREFFMQMLWHYPTLVSSCYRPEYEAIPWRNNETEFEKWCRGETGYPIVDAGMRELNQTGFMHNRVRMITASFLVKHLLIDWRWGEAYFAGKLLDYELASNNGNWQWVAGCGCDAAPYFRIFNPAEQAKKFDPQQQYIRTWVPEFESDDYRPPMVDHRQARERCLQVYKQALASHKALS